MLVSDLHRHLIAFNATCLAAKRSTKVHAAVTDTIYPLGMHADYRFGEDIDRIAQVAATLREFNTDLPMAEALEAQVAILEEAQDGPAVLNKNHGRSSLQQLKPIEQS